MPQIGHLHGFVLEAVGNQFAHVAGADAVIDRIVKPLALAAQHVRGMGFAKPGHAKQKHTFGLCGSPRRGVGVIERMQFHA